MTAFRRLVVVFLLLPVYGCNSGWHEHSSVDGKFKVLMPGQVKIETQPQLVEQGIVNVEIHSTETNDGVYMVAFAERPPDQKKPLKEVARTAYEGTILYQKEITVSGEEAIEFEVELEKPKGHAAGRMFYHEGRLYQLMAAGPNIRADSEKVRKFWDSFRLVD